MVVPEASTTGLPQPSPGACSAVWISNLAAPSPFAPVPAHLISFEVNCVKNSFELTFTGSLTLSFTDSTVVPVTERNGIEV